MGEWEFYRIPRTTSDGPPFLWAWRCVRPDGSLISTPENFRFLLDCVAHARLHGYAGGPLLTRRDPVSDATPRAEAPRLRAVS